MTQWSRSLGRQVLVEWLLGCHSKVSSSSVPWSLVRNVRLHARPAPRLGTSGVGPAISVIGSPRAGPDARWGLGRARRAGPLALLFTWETREIRVEMPEGRGSPSEEASQENGPAEKTVTLMAGGCSPFITALLLMTSIYASDLKGSAQFIKYSYKRQKK